MEGARPPVFGAADAAALKAFMPLTAPMRRCRPRAPAGPGEDMLLPMSSLSLSILRPDMPSSSALYLRYASRLAGSMAASFAASAASRSLARALDFAEKSRARRFVLRRFTAYSKIMCAVFKGCRLGSAVVPGCCLRLMTETQVPQWMDYA